MNAGRRRPVAGDESHSGVVGGPLSPSWSPGILKGWPGPRSEFTTSADLHRELFSMRQSWDLRPSGKVGGAGSCSLVLAGLLALCLGPDGTVQAQDESQKDEAGRSQGPRSRAPPPRRPRPPQPSTAPGGERGQAAGPREYAAVGDPGLGSDRAVLALLSVYFTALVIRLFMEFRVSEAVPAPLVEQARGRDPRQEVPGCVRRLQGQRLVPGPAGPHGDRQPAQRAGRGQGGRCWRGPKRSSPAWK